MEPEREMPILLNFVLRVMTSDGHLLEIDGNKEISIAVYPVQYSNLRYTRTSDHPIAMAFPTNEEMHAASNVMEEYADLILRSVTRSSDQDPPSGGR